MSALEIVLLIILWTIIGYFIFGKKGLKKLFSKIKNSPVATSKSISLNVLPLTIYKVSQLYPVPVLNDGNNATGEIKIFDTKGKNINVGQAIIINKEVWVHLGYNYFKNTVKP